MQAESYTEAFNLTTGVELECLLIRDRSLVDADSHGNMDVGLILMHEILSQPIEASCATCGVLHHFFLQLNPVCYPGKHLKIDPEYKNWSIDIDQSIEIEFSHDCAYANTLDGLYYYPIEIRSRVLGFSEQKPTIQSCGNPDHMHEITGEQEIAAVLHHLHDAFKAPRAPAGWRLLTNESCGFHVHVGNGKDGFPLSTVKNALSIYVACEIAMDTMHATSRIGGSTISTISCDGKPDYKEVGMLDRQPYNMPWSALFNFLPCLRGDPMYLTRHHELDEPERFYPGRLFAAFPDLKEIAQRNDVQSWLTLIERAQSIKDLQDLQRDFSHASTVDLENLCDPFLTDRRDCRDEEVKKMTIEFRQHAGTLRPLEVIAWLDFLDKLMRFAHTQTESQIHALCHGEWAQPDHDALDLMKLIGVCPQTFDYYRRRLGLVQGNERSYAAEMSMQEADDAIKVGTNTILLPMVCHEIEQRFHSNVFTNVRNRVNHKFLAGCYGLFSTEYLNQLNLKPEDQRRLTMK